jgi:UDPglucose 6-dehydrogenase
MIERISVIGLGKIGFCLATVLAYRGFKVIGVDVDKTKVKALNEFVVPIYEPNLKEMLSELKSRNNLQATTSYSYAISNSDAAFIIVPTPSTKRGNFSLRYVNLAIKEIGKVLQNKNDYFLVVLNSTVSPHSMFKIKAILEKYSNKTCCKDFGLCYNPEFLALGNAINGLLKPDFVLIGESDKKAGDLLEEIQKRLCLNNPKICRTNFICAEITKIALNMYITMKISFANMLAELCEKVPSASSDIITNILGSDRRIGHAYLKGGLGYGGPCFPRDGKAFEAFARKVGVNCPLTKATQQVNQRQVRRIVTLIMSKAKSKTKEVAVLGLTYRPSTNVVENSQQLMIAKELRKKGFKVHVYDPAYQPKSGFIVEKSAIECIKNSDIIIIATPWNEFKNFPCTIFKGKIVIDCWRILSRDAITLTNEYFAIGIGTYKKLL